MQEVVSFSIVCVISNDFVFLVSAFLNRYRYVHICTLFTTYIFRYHAIDKNGILKYSIGRKTLFSYWNEPKKIIFKTLFTYLFSFFKQICSQSLCFHQHICFFLSFFCVTAVRFGRVPKREKARILAAMQQSTQNRGHQRAMATELDDQPRLLAAVLRAHMETCEFTREKVTSMRQRARDCPSYSLPTMVSILQFYSFLFQTK